MDTHPISKLDLLKRYKENKSSFDIGVSKVLETPEITLDSLNNMKK